MHVHKTAPNAIKGLTVEWANATVPVLHGLALGELHVALHMLDPMKMLQLAKGGEWPPIDVIEFRGEYWVWNGHHRVWIAFLRGYPALPAMVSSLPG